MKLNKNKGEREMRKATDKFVLRGYAIDLKDEIILNDADPTKAKKSWIDSFAKKLNLDKSAFRVAFEEVKNQPLSDRFI
jgi:hypothetical protein